MMSQQVDETDRGPGADHSRLSFRYPKKGEGLYGATVSRQRA